MWSVWFTTAILLAGGAYVTGNQSIQTINVEQGEHFPLQVTTLSHTVTKCYLITPTKEIIDLIPDDRSGDRIALNEPNSYIGCGVTVSDVGMSDGGQWEIHAEVVSAEADLSEIFQVNVRQTGIPIESEEVDGEDDISGEINNVTWLPQIAYIVRRGISITISLSKTTHPEVCVLHTPRGEVKAITEKIEGVEAYGSSEYVSCRVVIGPINETLVDTWTLCGHYTEGGLEHVRCQSANLTWNNNNPSSSWTPDIRQKFNHAVHYGKIMQPAVRGLGTLHTCHVVTPLGEDLVITRESDYPNIAFVFRDLPTCSVDIGPIHETMLGDWMVYGRFTSALGFNEVQFPMHFSLYDEDNPQNQAYNVTRLDSVTRVVNVGVIMLSEVTSSGQVDDCSFITPRGVLYDLENVTRIDTVSFDNGVASCRIAIGPIAEELLGEWQLTGKFSHNGIFTERILPFQIKLEDPENPKEDNTTRRIDILGEEYFDTKISAQHRLQITAAGMFSEHESCHLRRPDQRQFQIMDGFNVPGIELIHDSSLACGIIITVTSGMDVGEWSLFSRDTILGTPTERRLEFTIYIEEGVDPMTSEVTIAESNDLHLRLRNPTQLHTTCRLRRPDGSYATNSEMDSNFVESCGFIVRNVQKSDDGKWTIEFGNDIVYTAPTVVNVVGRWQLDQYNLVWPKDRPVNIVMGPEDAVYCKIDDPSGFTVFDGFGKCNVTLERARREYAGIWKLTVGLPGRVLTQEHLFTVTVTEPAPKAVVRTSVLTDKPMVTLTCAVQTQDEVRACKFRDPSGRILLASGGVGEDRYSFQGTGISMVSNVRSHECGLRFENPETRDLGLWRCAVETENDVYYGFLTVLCPWAMMVPEVAAVVVSEPVLTTNGGGSISALEGHSVIMSCSISSPIRYCYFRARNGTVYSVEPGVSDGLMEYVGAGLDAGECGIRFFTLEARDTGAWSCHVGFPDHKEPEQRASFSVEVKAPITGSQALEGDWIDLEAKVPNGRVLEYCRFVRIDGFGFTSENVPDAYLSNSEPARGLCALRMNNPTILDMHPWTVVARINGQDEELSYYTRGSFRVSTPPPANQSSSSFIAWMIVVMVSLTLLFFGILFCNTKNRKWTSSRAAALRDSMRRSFQKKPLPDTNHQPHTNTAMAA